MTPQLQQAIRLLQLSTMELQTEIQDALDSNLMLEVADEEADGGGGTDGAESAANGVVQEETVPPVDIPNELPVDSAWDDIYDSSPTHVSAPEGNGADFDVLRGVTETLKDHLDWQMSLMSISDTDRIIGVALIDAVADDGYLATSVEDIHDSLTAQGLDVVVEEIEACLHRIQNFDPPGVAARDLRDCLTIQLLQHPAETPWRLEALELVSKHLDLLASRDFVPLSRNLNLDSDELQGVITLIQSLSPRPGFQIQSSAPEYVVPDVFVRKVNDVWRVELNGDAFPRLRVNSLYAGLIKRADSSADNVTMKNHLQEARWFLKSLRSRSETLLKVATCIVERQQGFLDSGEEAMKPMVLHDVAEAVSMHESTISRVTTQKYMHTPRGIYELKYFFSSHVYTKNGAACSSTAIRAFLKKLIAAENTQKPLSDSKLAEILADQGVNVARRTVAKYREAMSIPSSSERRSLT